VLTEEKIERRAIQMFDIYQTEINSIKDVYCNNFNNLREDYRKGWLKLAKVMLEGEYK